jgi:hypothetical protein
MCGSREHQAPLSIDDVPPELRHLGLPTASVLMRDKTADHVSPVDAPTEAEIEAWRKEMHYYILALLREQPIPGRGAESILRDALALMRRAAAATPAPSALERLRERVDAAASYEAIDLGEWRAFDKVLDWIDEERKREAGHG